MNLLIRQIPNTLTLLNLFLGTLAVIAVTTDRIPTAMILICACLVADILDGAIARKLGLANELGIQLDSVADMVSFAVLPSVMIYYMGSRYGGGDPGEVAAALAAGLNATSAGLRLARFNIDTRPREYFWGMATPAGAMVIAGWLWAQYNGRDLGLGVDEMPWLIIIIPVFLAVAYQLPVKLPGLKSPKKGLYLAGGLVMAVLIGFFTIGPISIPLGLIAYYLLGVINSFARIY